jgi:methylthioribose-1-phosphate isomerase
MSTWLKAGGAALAVAAVFLAGYKYAAALYEKDIADMQAEQALALKEKTDAYRAKEREQAARLSEAIDALAKARADAVDLSDDLDRVRQLADSYRAKLSAASPDSCDALKERLAGCTKLLEEGAELSAEGARLSGEVAAKKDAITRIHGTVPE